MRYETENNRLSILKHIKIGERIRDMVIDKDKNYGQLEKQQV